MVVVVVDLVVDAVVVGRVVLVVVVVVVVVGAVVVSEAGGLIGQPRASTLNEILSFHFVGYIRIHFAAIGQLKAFVTGVFLSELPVKVCNIKRCTFTCTITFLRNLY